jgi:hypothetical protein
MTQLLFLTVVTDRPNQLNDSRPLISGSFSWMLQTSKYFKLPNFSASRFRVWIAWVIETEIHLFLGKRIGILLPARHIKLSATKHVKSHHFSLSPSNLLLLTVPLPLLTPWLVRLTRPLASSMILSSMRIRVILRQRETF